MSTWNTTTTSSDDASPSGFEKLRDGVISWGKLIIKLLIVAIIILAELFSVPKVSDTQMSSGEIREEMDALIRKGATRELELKLTGSDNADLDLYRDMMTLVRTMRYGDFELEGSKANEFWTAFAPDKSETKLQYIRFTSEDTHVLLRYTNGIAAEITMEFDGSYLSKAVTLRHGIFNGNIFTWAYWNLIGRFINGYPRYVSEAYLSGSGLRGDVLIKKYVIKNQILHFSSDSHQSGMSVSDHWRNEE